MESTRFDHLSRSIGEASRRGVLRAAVAFLAPATLFAILDAPEAADAAKNGRCKPACGTCQVCKKGKCKKKHNGKKRCKKGKCKPAPVGTSCEDPLGVAGECCAPGTGGSAGGCCAANEACCPDSAGGGCCASLGDCCAITDDCADPLAICALGCCVLF